MGIRAVKTTTVDFESLITVTFANLKKLKIVVCNPLIADDYFFITIKSKGLESVWYSNTPILAYDTFVTPFEFQLDLQDIVEIKSLNGGLILSLIENA